MRNLLKAAIKRAVGAAGFELVRRGSVPDDLRRLRSDFSPEDFRLIEEVAPYTQTGPERIVALARSVEYVVGNGIPGAVVECGVWRGGSMMAAAKTLLRLGVQDRELYLFDTFEGMPPPMARDVSHWGEPASEAYARFRGGGAGGIFEANAVPLEEVKAAVLGVGYDPSRIHFIRGKVEDTLPAASPGPIALLRLDTDWYESTKHEMEHLFPLLSRGGVLILDDYGEWQGARTAVDEYIARNAVKILLNRIDHTGRIAVKL